MRPRLLFDSLLVGAALALSVEILARRWLLGQVPTQIGAGPFYALIALNLALAWAQLGRIRRHLAARKPGSG